MGKGRQAAKTEIERLKLREIACDQGINEVAKMCACRLLHPLQLWASKATGMCNLPALSRAVNAIINQWSGQKC